MSHPATPPEPAPSRARLVGMAERVRDHMIADGAPAWIVVLIVRIIEALVAAIAALGERTAPAPPPSSTGTGAGSIVLFRFLTPPQINPRA